MTKREVFEKRVLKTADNDEFIFSVFSDGYFVYSQPLGQDYTGEVRLCEFTLELSFFLNEDGCLLMCESLSDILDNIDFDKWHSCDVRINNKDISDIDISDAL